MSSKETRPLDPIKLIRDQQLKDAYREGSSGDGDGRTESLESILERALLEEAYRNEKR